ncbi:MAG: hypothetical protein ABSD48_01035 [Armatimonadota bacterium]|jgi:sugar lactone lactonase YvrE
MITRVRYHVLRDIKGKSINVNEQREHGQEFKDNYIAFTCLLAHPKDGLLYCGVTAFNTDVLHAFDPEAKAFRSLGYQAVAEPFEIKIHRSLELASDGAIYGASACLHGLNRRLEAPGGALFRYSPKTGQTEKLGIPVARDYIQTISLDEKRGLIYGQTYPVFNFFVYHLSDGRVDDFGYVGSITHISAIDDQGCVWGTWDPVLHNLFKYDPAQGKIVFFDHGLPEGAKMGDLMYPGSGPVDCMINGGDGYIYIGTTGGTLVRLNPKTADVRYLGKPYASRRMPGLKVWKDGLLLGVVGDTDLSYLFAYDRETGRFIDLGPIVDTESRLPLYRTHDLAITSDRQIYVAETDVPSRSGYLWECEVDY